MKHAGYLIDQGDFLGVPGTPDGAGYGAAPMPAVDPLIEELRLRRVARRNVTPLVMGQAVSLFGDYLAYFALPWFILELTSRSRDLGLVAAAETLPLAVFGIAAGLLLDRVRIKGILILADLVRAGAFLALAVAAENGAATWMVFLTAFVVGTMSTVFDSGLQAILPAMVGNDLLVPVNARLSMAHTLAWPAGVAAAGLLVTQSGGFSIVFAANSYTFVISALFLSQTRQLREQPRGSSFGGRSGISAGLRFLRRESVLFWATLGAAVTKPRLRTARGLVDQVRG